MKLLVIISGINALRIIFAVLKNFQISVAYSNKYYLCMLHSSCCRITTVSHKSFTEVQGWREPPFGNMPLSLQKVNSRICQKYITILKIILYLCVVGILFYTGYISFRCNIIVIWHIFIAKFIGWYWTVKIT